jgi:very-short-patch-repair endonuclease
MKYKLNDFWFEYDSEALYCNCCGSEVNSIKRKKHNTKEEYVEVFSNCSNVDCKFSKGKKVGRYEKLLAILPNEIGKERVKFLKSQATENRKEHGKFNFRYWEKRGYLFEEYKIELAKLSSDGSKKVKNRFKKTKENVLKNGYSENDFNKIFKSNRSIKHWTEKGFSEENSKEKIRELQIESTRHIDYSKRLTENNIQYWIERGLSKEEAKEKVSERQKTFSLDICIEKYGEEKGRERWSERQEKWMKSYKRSNFSKISQELFWEVYNRLDDKFKNYKDIRFAEFDFENKTKTEEVGRNFEFVLRLKSRSYVKPDFIVLEDKKIIEFDGTYFHNTNAESNEREKKRDRKIIETGYDVLHISEFDFKNNSEEEIKKCLEFLKN